jgi:hypothetical protein
MEIGEPKEVKEIRPVTVPVPQVLPVEEPSAPEPAREPVPVIERLRRVPSAVVPKP